MITDSKTKYANFGDVEMCVINVTKYANIMKRNK